MKTHSMAAVLQCWLVCAAIGFATVADGGILGIYNTGVDAGGNVLAPGSTDPHYDITSVPGGGAFGPAVVQANHPAWMANDPVGGPGSSFISTVSSGPTGIPPGTYVFQTTVDLTGLSPSTAEISGQFSVDNSVSDVLLNGNSLAISGAGFGGWTPFAIDSGFQAGVNTLDFVVSNHPPNNNPGGFRAEMTGAALPDGTLVPMQATITGDDGYELYISDAPGWIGIPIGSAGGWETAESYNTEVPADSELFLHIVGNNGFSNGGDWAGVIAEFDFDLPGSYSLAHDPAATSIVTNGDWMGNSTGFGNPSTPVNTRGPYPVSPWNSNVDPDFGGSTYWIWNGPFVGSGGTAPAYLSYAFQIVVPEPATLLVWSLLTGLGVGLGWRRRR